MLLSSEAGMYFKLHVEPTIEDELSFRVSVHSLLKYFKKTTVVSLLHQSHTGIHGCISQFRQTYTWPSMTWQVKQMQAKYVTYIRFDQGRDTMFDEYQTNTRLTLANWGSGYIMP